MMFPLIVCESKKIVQGGIELCYMLILALSKALYNYLLSILGSCMYMFTD